MHFWKYQALGNDYLVVQAAAGGVAAARVPDEEDSRPVPLGAERVRAICDRHFGVGSDGILIHQPSDADGRFCLKILNPDGSEAEKSGNGLRIFARYLYDRGLVNDAPFEVETAGGRVVCEVLQNGRAARVDMGAACFDSTRIPVAGEPREVLQERIEIAGQALEFSAVSLGNPHCVLFRPRVSKQEACELGPLLEVEPRFPNRTNVQFAQLLDRGTLQIEIWERGAGYTLASGSSASAAAAVAHKLGLCDAAIRVRMAGGDLAVEIGAGFEIRIEGPVGAVATGEIAAELLAAPDSL